MPSEGWFKSSTVCKQCLYKCASKYGSKDPRNKHVSIPLTNRNLPSVHYESVPRSKSKSHQIQLHRKKNAATYLIFYTGTDHSRNQVFRYCAAGSEENVRQHNVALCT